MKDAILGMISRYVANNMDWFIKTYSKDSSILKNFLYESMPARKKEGDRKLLNY